MIKFILAISWFVALTGCAHAAQPPAEAETTWPIGFDTTAGRIEVYQPQPESLTGDKLEARAAVSLLAPGSAEPMFGAIWMTSRFSTDRDDRTVTIRDVDVTAVRFPDADAAKQAQTRPAAQATQALEKQFEQTLEKQLPTLNIMFSLDELMTSLDLAKRGQGEVSQLPTNPPHILFSGEPATLINIDGAPRLQRMLQENVERVANTPFILLRDTTTNRYYLKTGQTWSGTEHVQGPWQDGVVPPSPIVAAAAVLAEATTPPVGASTQSSGPPGKIIVATEPTELIVTQGDPEYAPITTSGDLLYITNTQSDVFLDVPAQQTYVLFSGRWFRAKALTGPWEYVSSDKLPKAFGAIPADSVKADVLTFVAGTTEAKEAVLDASIPQTADIRRDAGTELKVTYDGPPVFERIGNTNLFYLTNTSEPVITDHGFFYCCHEGAWYQSSSANGPWMLCTSVPSEIYTIPPSSPVYNCTYVHVYDYDADSVLCGYLPGYTGCYVSGPTIVYGTGYVYPGWFQSYYIPRPCTYGFGAYYDPWIATWDFGFGCGWGPLWIAHDHFHHHWFGPGGFRHHWHDWHGWAGRRFDHLHDFRGDRVNIYHRPANAGHNFASRPAGANRRFDVRAGGLQNNVFAGHDGHVYRRTDGGWEQRDNQAWITMHNAPEARPNTGGKPFSRNGVEADHAARERGVARTNGFRGGAVPPSRGGTAPSRGDGGGAHIGGGGGFHGGAGGGHR